MLAYEHGDDPDDDDAERGGEMVRDTGKDLASDDAVENEEALHGEDVECARDHRPIVPALLFQLQKV